MAQFAGQTLVWGLTTRDATGALADVATGPTATVTKPDGTTGAATVSKTATGTYQATYASTDPGRYTIVWTGSGSNSGGLPYSDVRDVLSAANLIISLADARASLNLPAGTVVHDSELIDYIAATTEVIQSYTGPILSGSKVQTLDGSDATEGGTALTLSVYPTAISSVVEDGVTLASTLYSVGRGGILWRDSGTWATGRGNIVVTMTVGSTVRPNVALAAREQLRHLWQVGQIAGRPILGDTAAGVSYVPHTGFAVPNRVLELLAADIGSAQGLGVH